MTPIGKGARFLVLSGVYRGRVGVIVRGVVERLNWWTLDLGEGDLPEVTTEDLADPMFKRLADAPAEVDPVAAEVLAAAIALRRLYHDRSRSDDAYGGASEAFWKRIDALGGRDEGSVKS